MKGESFRRGWTPKAVHRHLHSELIDSVAIFMQFVIVAFSPFEFEIIFLRKISRNSSSNIISVRSPIRWFCHNQSQYHNACILNQFGLFWFYFPVAVLCCSEVQCFKRAISKRKILTFPGWIKCGGGGGRISPPDSSSGPLSAFERPRPPFIVFSSVPPFEWAFGSCTLNRTSWNSGPTSEQPREPTFCCIFEKPDGRLPANKNSWKYYLFIYSVLVFRTTMQNASFIEENIVSDCTW